MSDKIPLEIQMDIIQRIPDTKSVIRCRSVSKAWKSMIDGKEFLAAHTLRRRHQANRHLLVSIRDGSDGEVTYMSVVDDDTFPHQKVSVFVPDSANKLFSHPPVILGTCLGLFCLFASNPNTAVIWNPSIRKTVAIPVPGWGWTNLGFGVCPRNLDPKLVKITFFDDSTQVEVFRLSSGGTWRSPLSGNGPHKSIRFGDSQVVVDGFIYYWYACGSVDKLIMSFDLTSEEFTNVNFPDPLAHPHANLLLFNLRDSLAVVDFEWPGIFHVWQRIGHRGCTRSFSKLYTINGPNASIYTIFAFRKSGAPIVAMEIFDEDDNHILYVLAIYEPESKSLTDIGIQLLSGSFFVHSYMETLLLLAH